MIIDFVHVPFISVEEQTATLKSHNVVFSLFCGFDVNSRYFMQRPDRAAVYDEIAKLIFAQWNDSLRLDNVLCDVEIFNRCNSIFKDCMKRNAKEPEHKQMLRDVRKIYREAFAK